MSIPKMSIDSLSTEIIQRIYDFAHLADTVRLARTSQKTYKAFLGRRLHILECGLDNAFGPVPELFKLVMSSESHQNARWPLGTEKRRNAIVNRIVESISAPKLSIETMKKMVPYGRVALRWAEIYPQLRWRIGYKNRRFLRSHEQERLRRAIYNYWMYCNLFQDDTYTQYDPSEPDVRRNDPRLRLLSTLPTMELVQLSELLEHIVQLLETELYPSYSSVCEGGSHYSKLALSRLAWGDDAEYRFLRDCLLKYDPCDLLHVIDNTSTKSQRRDCLVAKGQAFQETRATLPKALEVVVANRANINPCVLGTFPSIFGSSFSGKCFFQESEDEEIVFGIADLENENSEERKTLALAMDGNRTGNWPP